MLHGPIRCYWHPVTQSCSRDIKKDHQQPPPTDLVVATDAERTQAAMEDVCDVDDPTLWLCLQCAHLGCGRNSKMRHALKHYQTPRSNSHAIVLNIHTGIIWCYDCDDEISTEHSKRLCECVEFINKQMALSTLSTGVRNGRLSSDVGQEKLSTERGEDKCAKQQNKLNASAKPHLPSVKGLSNLGNTCFFNAVMQNLNRTPLLESMLTELGQKGQCVDLPGCRPSDSYVSSGAGSSDADDGVTMMTKSKVEVPPLQVTLPEGGPLTQSVLAFLNEMNASNRNSTVFPNKLFGQVCKKAPRFKGFQQQDSHELLRHLLDGMKAEEIKRSYSAILNAYQLPSTVNPKKVDDEMKLKIKEHGRQVKHTFVDQLFGGYFLSSVLCEECQMPSQMLEPFLDISLPVLEEKIPRPNMDWKHDADSRFATDGAIQPSKTDTQAGTNKHMTKKAKKQAKRDAKKKNQAKRRPVHLPVKPPSGSIGTENGMEAGEDAGEDVGEDAVEEEEEDGDNNSDADVEDNTDTDLSRNPTFDQSQSTPTPTAIDDTTIATCENSEQNVADGNMDTPVAESVKDYVTTLTEPNGVSDSTKCEGAELNADCFVDDGRTIELQISDAMRAVSLMVDSSDICHLSGELTCGASSMDSGTHGSIDITTEVEDESGKYDSAGTLRIATAHEAATADRNCGDDGSSGDTLRPVTEPTRKLSHVENGSGDVCCDSGLGETDSSRPSASTATLTSGGHHRERWRHERLRAMRPLAGRPQLVASECSILSCLADFTTAELLTGANRFGCATCSLRKHGRQSRKGKQIVEYTNASKQFLIFRPPAILTLHLKRFQQVGYSLRKMNRHVDFTMLLDLAPYCSELAQDVQPGKKQVMYSLYGAVEHSGRLSGGHYTAYVKVRSHSPQIRDFLFHGGVNDLRLEKLWEALATPETPPTPCSTPRDETVKPPAGKWYYISDSRVNEVVSETNVLKCQAYLLFYERIY